MIQTIKSIKLFPKQLEVVNKVLKSKAKFHILNASRQSGKSTLAEQLCCYWAINHNASTILYITPTYALSNTIFNGLVAANCFKEINKTKLYIKFKNGSIIHFKSAEAADQAIRGMSVDYAIIDEAAYIDEQSWSSAIRPTLNVKGKKCLILSTPKGRNWFYNYYNLGGINDNYCSYKLHYTDNKLYDLKEVEDARNTLPPSIYDQEYEAKFIDTGGAVFTNLDKVAIIKVLEKKGSKFFAGLDLGKKDYTVLTILNEEGEVVYKYRKNNTNWRVMINDVVGALQIYKPYTVVEVNSVGDVVFDYLKQLYNRVEPYFTQNNNKQEIIEDLIMAFADGKVKIPTEQLDPILYKQLEVFTFTYSPKTRRIVYAAPNGHNDDDVMSLAFANYARRSYIKNKVNVVVW